MKNFYYTGRKFPKIDSKIRLQFRDHAIITVEPDQENSVSTVKPSLLCLGSGVCGGEHEVCELLSKRVVQLMLS